VLRGALKKARDGLISLCYPDRCRACGQLIESWDDGIACARCWEDPKITPLFQDMPICQRCGAPAKTDCAQCQTLPISAARACGAYKGAIQATILFLKRQPYICPRLSKIIELILEENRSVLASDLIIPIPLHEERQKERGFNQAAIIAKFVARHYDSPIDELSLVRIKPTQRHRAGMDHIDRSRSVKGAFKVVRPKLIEGASILLVDDLYTTGSTICEAARTLLEAGADRVSAFTIARATSNPGAV
jgi:competence protein ComFC